MPEIPNSYVSIAGLMVGTAGLVFTILAWRRASSAEKAATEARDSVRHGNAAEDLRDLAERAKELLNSVEHGHIDAARLCCRDLGLGINVAKQRWSGILPTPSTIDRLQSTAVSIEKVSVSLQSSTLQMTEPQKTRLLKFCHEVLRILSEESGSMFRKSEEGK